MATRQLCYYQKNPIIFKKMARPNTTTLVQLAESSKQSVERRGLEMPPQERSISSLDDMRKYLFDDCMSIKAEIDARMALLCQKETNATISYDMIYDNNKMCSFPLVSRVGPGMAMSDHLFYYILSPNYTVVPFFHTHPEIENELGRHMPSIVDLQTLYHLSVLQGDMQMFDTVLFLDGTAVAYSVGSDGIPFIETRLDSINFCEQ